MFRTRDTSTTPASANAEAVKPVHRPAAISAAAFGGLPGVLDLRPTEFAMIQEAARQSNVAADDFCREAILERVRLVFEQNVSPPRSAPAPARPTPAPAVAPTIAPASPKDGKASALAAVSAPRNAPSTPTPAGTAAPQRPTAPAEVAGQSEGNSARPPIQRGPRAPGTSSGVANSRDEDMRAWVEEMKRSGNEDKITPSLLARGITPHTGYPTALRFLSQHFPKYVTGSSKEPDEVNKEPAEGQKV